MSYKYFLVFIFLLCVVEVILADQKLCDKLNPCGDRGVCPSDEASKHILTIKCICRSNYTGQWCQYVDGKYQPGPKGKVPSKPMILTETRFPKYKQKYFLKFEGVKDPPAGKVLYYLVRYADVTQGEWRSVAVENKGGVHKILLDKLDWGHKYKLELYAGNTHGLGEPARTTLKKPKVPVNGGWSTWSDFGACSVSCGAGVKHRSRNCNNPKPKHGGKECAGNSQFRTQCNMPPCKVNGGWSTWSSWTSCSTTCNTGVQKRSRKCNNPIPKHGGKVCQGTNTMSKECMIVPCKVDGGWSSWSDFSTCSVSCGAGVKYRTRNCNNPRPEHGGKECEGKSQFRTQCNRRPCKVNGGWSTWSSWTSCSTTCNTGSQMRSRKCTNPIPKHGGKVCQGTNTMTKKCMLAPCKVDGGWSSWSEFGACSVSCDAGVKYRTRNCNNPEPKHGGKECEGNSQYRTQCDMPPCKVNGGWSTWSFWTSCSTTCNTGVQWRARSCTDPIPKYGGTICQGNSTMTKECMMVPCKVDGGWSCWSDFGACSVSCGAGVKYKTRLCNNPRPEHGGKKCEGNSEYKTKCNKLPCKVHGGWSLWSNWSSCSVTCDSGVKTRVRSCTRPKPAHGGNECHGKHELQAKCQHKPCKDIKDKDMKLAKKSSGFSSYSMIYTFVAGIGSLVLLGMLCCGYRALYLRLQNKEYIPLTKVKTQPKPSLKGSSKLPLTKHGSVTSDTSDIFSKLASVASPLTPLPTCKRPTRVKRHPGGKTKQLPETPKDDISSLDATALERRKINDMPVHKTSKHSGLPNVPNNPLVSSFTHKGSTSSDVYTIEKAVSESGKVRVAQVHKMTLSTVSQASPSSDEIDLSQVGNPNGSNVVKDDSSSSLAPKGLSESPVVPSGFSVGSKCMLGSGDGGLIGFENAIFETGDDNVKNAMIQKMNEES